MSANNYILIKENAKGKYVVTHRDADTNHIFDTISLTRNLKTACEKATDFMSQEVVEYGISFDFYKKKNEVS